MDLSTWLRFLLFQLLTALILADNIKQIIDQENILVEVSAMRCDEAALSPFLNITVIEKARRTDRRH